MIELIHIAVEKDDENISAEKPTAGVTIKIFWHRSD